MEPVARDVAAGRVAPSAAALAWVKSARALPAPVLKSLEQYIRVLDISKWGPPYDDIADYKNPSLGGRR